jgi:tRNA(fMet)-specific endonuclease VapC
VRFLLDSNIVIAASLGVGVGLRQRMEACDEGDLVTSAIVFSEVALGSMRGKPPPLDRLELFIEEVPVLPFDLAASEAYARLPFRRASFDHLIAAHALSLDLTLVTDNLSDFSSVPGLSVQNWLRLP